MLWVLGLILSVQVVQVGMCGLSLITLAHLIPRIMFAWRVFGKVYKPRTLAIMEGVLLFVWLVWRGIVRHNLTIRPFIVYVVCVLVSVLVYYIDTERSVYDIRDVD